MRAVALCSANTSSNISLRRPARVSAQEGVVCRRLKRCALQKWLDNVALHGFHDWTSLFTSFPDRPAKRVTCVWDQPAAGAQRRRQSVRFAFELVLSNIRADSGDGLHYAETLLDAMAFDTSALFAADAGELVTGTHMLNLVEQAGTDEWTSFLFLRTGDRGTRHGRCSLRDVAEQCAASSAGCRNLGPISTPLLLWLTPPADLLYHVSTRMGFASGQDFTGAALAQLPCWQGASGA